VHSTAPNRKTPLERLSLAVSLFACILPRVVGFPTIRRFLLTLNHQPLWAKLTNSIRRLSMSQPIRPPLSKSLEREKSSLLSGWLKELLELERQAGFNSSSRNKTPRISSSTTRRNRSFPSSLSIFRFLLVEPLLTFTTRPTSTLMSATTYTSISSQVEPKPRQLQFSAFSHKIDAD